MTVQHESDIEYAGFWVRVGATLIDTIILMMITVPMLLSIYGSGYWENSSFIAGPADFMISYVLPAVVVIILWVKLSTTPGKMAMGATIVDAQTGEKPTTSQFVIRYLGYYVSMIPFLLGFIWVGIDPRKQGWHDKMAGTVVIKRKAGGGQPVRFDQQG